MPLLLPPGGNVLRFSIICAMAATGVFAAPVQRDWQRYPAIVQSDQPDEIFVIGDVHADYKRAVKVLRAARLMNDNPDAPENEIWRGGKAIVIFLGDLVDKGPDSLRVVQLVATLQTGAVKEGGRVIALMGNHEAEFLANPYSPKVSDFFDSLSAAGIDPISASACGGAIGDFLCTMPFAARVRDWFFSHAGNTRGRSLAELETAFRKSVDGEGYQSSELQDPDSILEARLFNKDSEGANWFDQANSRTRDVLTAYADALGVKHLVQGHQPGDVKFQDGVVRHAGEFFQRYSLLFLADVGMSAGIGDSKGGVLHIRTRDSGQQVTVVCSDSNRRTLWRDGEKGDSVDRESCGN